MDSLQGLFPPLVNIIFGLLWNSVVQLRDEKQAWKSRFMRSEHDRASLSQEMYFYGSNVTRCNIIPWWCEHGAGRDWLSSWNCKYHPFPSHSLTSWITSASVCKVSVEFIFWKALILKFSPPPPQEVRSMSNVHRPLASKRKCVHMDLAYLVLFKKSSISAYSASGACLGCHKSVVLQPN